MKDKTNGIGKTSGGTFKQFTVIILLGVSLYLSEGLMGFRPLLNVETFVLVFGGTFLMTWAAYPLKEIFSPTGPEVILFAAGRAMAMGMLTTVLGAMLILASVTDTSEILRRMALALSGLFFGLLLSKVLLEPMAARFARE